MTKQIRIKIILTAIVIAGLSILGAMYVYRQENRPRLLEVYIFNLKNSQSVFIRTPNDKRILINGGSNSEIIRDITKVLPFYSRRIDKMIVTDFSAKNITGLIDVFDRYLVSDVFVPMYTVESLGIASTSDQIREVFIETVAKKGILIVELSQGKTIELDRSHDEKTKGIISMDILFPAKPDSFAYSKASSPGIVSNISYGETALYLLGNTSPKIQKYIGMHVATSTNVENVLVTSTTATPDKMAKIFTDKLRPKYLVYSKSISMDANSASNPSKNKKADPLKNIPVGNRFNVREYDFVKITSEGHKLLVQGEK